MAPEMIENGDFSIKTDSYAYGIVLWEMLSGEIPYFDVKVEQLVLMNQISNNEKPLRPKLSHIPAGVDRYLLDLMQICWDHNPHKRPRMGEIIEFLKSRGERGLGGEREGSETEKRIEGYFVRKKKRKFDLVSEDRFKLMLAELKIGEGLDLDEMGKVFKGVVKECGREREKTLTVQLILKFWRGMEEEGKTLRMKFGLGEKEENGKREDDPRSRWGVEEVVKRLKSVGLEEIAKRFEKHRIDGLILIDLTDEAFQELGVHNPDHRETIQNLHQIDPSSIAQGQETQKRIAELQKLIEQLKKSPAPAPSPVVAISAPYPAPAPSPTPSPLSSSSPCDSSSSSSSSSSTQKRIEELRKAISAMKYNGENAPSPTHHHTPPGGMGVATAPLPGGFDPYASSSYSSPCLPVFTPPSPSSPPSPPPSPPPPSHSPPSPPSPTSPSPTLPPSIPSFASSQHKLVWFRSRFDEIQNDSTLSPAKREKELDLLVNQMSLMGIH